MVGTIINDAKKIAYLARVYPNKTLEELLSLFLMPRISKDVALREAETQGWLTVDVKNNKFTLGEDEIIPNEDEWIYAIKARIVAFLRMINHDQIDIVEETLLQFLGGFPPHDTMISITSLVSEGTISNYEIHDGENIYTFYTLPENASQEWGKKAFKKSKNLKVEPKI